MDFVMVAIMHIMNKFLRELQYAGSARLIYFLEVGLRARAAVCSMVRVLRHSVACRTPVTVRSSGIAFSIWR